MLDKQGHMHSRPCTRPLARAHTHTHKFAIFIAFPGNNDRESASVLRYTYIGYLVPYVLYQT